MIAAVGNDGIIIGADTRGELNHERDTLCYINGFPKIFTTKHFAICITRYYFINGKSLQFYINRFNEQDHSELTSITSSLDNFLFFIRDKFPAALQYFIHQSIVTCGYYNGKPFMCVNNQDTGEGQCGSGYSTYSATDTFSKFKFALRSCEDNAKLIEEAIVNYPIKFHATTTIGGPTMILKISPDNTFHWIKRPKQLLVFETLPELREIYKRDKLDIHFISKKSKDSFDQEVSSWR